MLTLEDLEDDERTYSFDELSDDAKQRARQWYIEQLFFADSDEFDCTIDDFKTVAEMIGVDFATHTVKLRGGKTRQEPSIWWSGFCSQGDGACFEGTYRYRPEATTKIRAYAPQDEELHRIADQLAKIQERWLFGIHAEIAHVDRYYHENSVAIEVVDERTDETAFDEDGAVCELMRDLMRWLYRQLDRHNDWLYSDEHVDECITANEYMFDEEGNHVG
jgi:hypothetical protein